MRRVELHLFVYPNKASVVNAYPTFALLQCAVDKSTIAQWFVNVSSHKRECQTVVAHTSISVALLVVIGNYSCKHLFVVIYKLIAQRIGQGSAQFEVERIIIVHFLDASLQ